MQHGLIRPLTANEVEKQLQEHEGGKKLEKVLLDAQDFQKNVEFKLKYIFFILSYLFKIWGLINLGLKWLQTPFHIDL